VKNSKNIARPLKVEGKQLVHAENLLNRSHGAGETRKSIHQAKEVTRKGLLSQESARRQGGNVLDVSHTAKLGVLDDRAIRAAADGKRDGPTNGTGKRRGKTGNLVGERWEIRTKSEQAFPPPDRRVCGFWSGTDIGDREKGNKGPLMSTP